MSYLGKSKKEMVDIILKRIGKPQDLDVYNKAEILRRLSRLTEGSLYWLMDRIEDKIQELKD